jgi:hypothetical protein
MFMRPVYVSHARIVKRKRPEISHACVTTRICYVRAADFFEPHRACARARAWADRFRAEVAAHRADAAALMAADISVADRDSIRAAAPSFPASDSLMPARFFFRVAIFGAP